MSRCYSGREAAHKLAPGSLLVTYGQALLDYSEGKNKEARESLQRILKSAPNHMPSVLLAAAVELNLDSPQSAQMHLRKYLEVEPNNVYARKLMAQAMLKNAQPADAASMLAPALKDTSENQDTKISPHFVLKQFLCKEDTSKSWPKYVLFKERLPLKPAAAD